MPLLSIERPDSFHAPVLRRHDRNVSNQNMVILPISRAIYRVYGGKFEIKTQHKRDENYGNLLRKVTKDSR